MALNTGMLSSRTSEWYTPHNLLAAIGAFYGGAWYDPCPARQGEPLTHDALVTDWVQAAGTTRQIFVNPPYGRGIGKWVGKAVDFAGASPMHQAILLVPARTDTRWLQPLLHHPICFIAGRIHFSGATSGAPFPSALVYLGWASTMFARHFTSWGVVVNQERAMMQSEVA